MKYKILLKIVKIINVILLAFFLLFGIFLINGSIERVAVKKEINNFKKRAVYEEKIIAADVASHTEGWQRPIDGGKNMG